jgi:hypothetical protein
MIGSGKFSSVYRCRIKDATLGRDELDRNRVQAGFDEHDTSDEELAVKVLDKSTIISQSMTKQALLDLIIHSKNALT